MPFARNGTIALWYEDDGPPAAPVVVLVPGTGRQATDSDRIGDALVTAGYRVLRMDNRDVGPSTALADTPANLPALFAAATGGPSAVPAYDAFDMARDILAVMDAASVPRAHIVGRSVGGMAAQCAAIAAPERIASLVLVMTAARSVAELVTAERMAKLEDETIADADAFAARQVMAARANGLPQDFDAARIEAEARTAFVRGVHAGGTARHYGVALSLPDLQPALAALTIPALVIHGAQDAVVPPAFGREIAAAIPGARYIEQSDMGHDSPPRVQDSWIAPLLEHLQGAIA